MFVRFWDFNLDAFLKMYENITMTLLVSVQDKKMNSPAISIFPLDSKPYGLTYQQWCIKWWQWLVSIPRVNNPAFDLIGKNVNMEQYDPNVFFLCQTIEGVKRPPYRKSTIPAGRAVFMPIMNWLSIIGINGQTNNELISAANIRMDVVQELEIKINGLKLNKELKKHRISTPFFNIVLPEDNIFDLPAGQRISVSDGYWIFFQPLRENVKLSSSGSCSSGRTSIRVNYELTVI
jgi:hypothetical protein